VLRELTVDTSNDNGAEAVLFDGTVRTDGLIENVTALATAAQGSSEGIHIDFASPVLRDVTALVSGAKAMGIVSGNGSPTFDHVQVQVMCQQDGCVGMQIGDGNVAIQNSSVLIRGGTNGPAIFTLDSDVVLTNVDAEVEGSAGLAFEAESFDKLCTARIGQSTLRGALQALTSSMSITRESRLKSSAASSMAPLRPVRPASR
jgi:hypothetical protein